MVNLVNVFVELWMMEHPVYIVESNLFDDHKAEQMPDGSEKGRELIAALIPPPADEGIEQAVE